VIKEIAKFIVSKIGWELDFDAGMNEPNIGDKVSTPSDANFFIVNYALTSGVWGALGKGKLWIKKPGDAICGWLDNDIITNNTLINQLATCEFTVGALTTSLIIGDTLQVGHRPQDAPDACDTILESSGGSIIFDLPERADLAIQVLSRAKTYFTARARAWAIYDAIFRDWIYGSAGWTLPIVTVGEEYEAMIIEPMATPQYIGTDEKNRAEFSCNYIFKTRKI